MGDRCVLICSRALDPQDHILTLKITLNNFKIVVRGRLGVDLDLEVVRWIMDYIIYIYIIYGNISVS